MKIRTFLKAVAAYTLVSIASISAASAQVIPLDFTINFQNYVNKKNGVAGIDVNGNVTAPIDSSFGKFGLSAGHLTYSGSSSSDQPRINFLQDPSGNVPSEAVNNIPWRDMFTLGGINADDKMFFNVSGQPYGGGSMAVVDNVFMDGANVAQGTGVTAGPWANMLGYENYDAAARGTVVKSAPAYFVASSAIKDPDGNSHTVTFTATGAKFSPALPIYWASKLRHNMTIMTNEVAADISHWPDNNWTSTWSHHLVRHYNVYSGTLTGWHTQSDGSVDSVTVDGWVAPGQNLYGLGSTNGKVPGVDTLDGTAPSLDNYFTNIVDSNGTLQPAIMFGVYTKQFIAYDVCSLEPQGTHGDLNNPSGNIGSMAHECDHERDLWNSDPVDYKNSLKGFSITVNNTGGKLSDDSYLLALQGGGSMPLGIQVWNLEDNAPALQIFGNGTGVRTALYSPTTVGEKLGDYFRSSITGYSVVPGGNYTGSIMWTQYRDIDGSGAGDNSTRDWHTSSVHLQFRTDYGGDPRLDTGTPGGQIVFNPVGHEFGIGIGAGGSFQTPNYGLIVGQSGYVYLGPAGIFNFEDTSGNSVGGFEYSTQYSILYHHLATEFTNSVNLDAASPGLTVFNKTTTGTLEVNSGAQFDGPVILSGDIIRKPTTDISSTGSSLSDAYAITTHYSNITTVPSGTGVRLPTNVAGKDFVVWNRGTNDLNIYPSSSTDQIESYGAGKPFVLHPNGHVTFASVSSTLWLIL